MLSILILNFIHYYTSQGFQKDSHLFLISLFFTFYRHQKEVTALAEEDPILRALLKNKTIDESQFKNEDKEIFEAKKKWVEQYKQTLQEAEKVGVEFETTEKKFWLFDSEKRSEKWENLKNNYTFWPEDDKAKKYKRISS